MSHDDRPSGSSSLLIISFSSSFFYFFHLCFTIFLTLRLYDPETITVLIFFTLMTPARVLGSTFHPRTFLEHVAREVCTFDWPLPFNWFIRNFSFIFPRSGIAVVIHDEERLRINFYKEIHSFLTTIAKTIPSYD